MAVGLDMAQRTYLRGVLSGASVSAKPVLETSINRTAMEVLGCRVVENGRVPSEHAPMMRGQLVRRKRRYPGMPAMIP